MDKYKTDICCLQETKITKNFDETTPHGNRLITIPSNSQQYGNGFILYKKYKNSIHAYWKISDRFCVLQLKTNKLKNKNSPHKNLIDHIITIINVYGPIPETQHPEGLCDLYNDLTTLNNDLKNLPTSMILIAGNFNREVGKADEFETCIGKWICSHRNDNGQKLVEWCKNKNKFLCNNAFQHKQIHKATWSNSVINSKTNTVYHIYDQINYIIMGKNQIQSTTDA